MLKKEKLLGSQYAEARAERLQDLRTENVQIKKPTLVLEDPGRLCAKMKFERQENEASWMFEVANKADNKRLITLMGYAEEEKLHKLEGRIVRVILDSRGRKIVGLGHPIEDKFFMLDGKKFAEYSEAVLKEKYAEAELKEKLAAGSLY